MDAEQLEAERFVEGTLREGYFKKLSSGIHGLHTLAALWDRDEDADMGPGTWAEYLCWGRVYLTQKREVKLLEGGGPGLRGFKRVWKVGLIEPVSGDTEHRDLK